MNTTGGVPAARKASIRAAVLGLASCAKKGKPVCTEAAGQSLIGEQVELPVRGLEDKAYGDTRVKPGEGPSVPVPAAPSSGGLDSGWKP